MGHRFDGSFFRWDYVKMEGLRYENEYRVAMFNKR